MVSGSPLKLIAIVMPEPVYSQVREQQLSIARQWGPRHALRTPPHITLIPPIRISSDQNKYIREMCDDVRMNTQPFEFSISGYGFFTPTVIFMEPDKNEHLDQLYQLLRKRMVAAFPHLMKKYPDRGFQPHITLAHRDVQPDIFFRLKKFYSAEYFHSIVPVREFHLLQHAREGWQIEETFALAEKTD